jgi:hypothetical protein
VAAAGPWPARRDRRAAPNAADDAYAELGCSGTSAPTLPEVTAFRTRSVTGRRATLQGC